MIATVLRSWNAAPCLVLVVRTNLKRTRPIGTSLALGYVRASHAKKAEARPEDPHQYGTIDKDDGLGYDMRAMVLGIEAYDNAAYAEW
jgi:hypothetical protein